MGGQYDVVTANPPYISRKGYEMETSRSVRRYEPRGALVPPSRVDVGAGDGRCGDEAQGDLFYAPVMDVARRVGAKVVMMEVAGLTQALRVVGVAKKKRLGWCGGVERLGWT